MTMHPVHAAAVVCVFACVVDAIANRSQSWCAPRIVWTLYEVPTRLSNNSNACTHIRDLEKSLLRVLWVYEETRLLPQIPTIFSVALRQNFAFLPRRLMVSHSQGFCSLCPVFVVFCQHICSQHYRVLLTMWTVWWWHGFLLKMVITA